VSLQATLVKFKKATRSCTRRSLGPAAQNLLSSYARVAQRMVVEIYPEFSKPEDKISPNSYDGTMSGRAGPKKLIPVKEQNKSQAFMEIPLFGGLSEHLCAAERVALRGATCAPRRSLRLRGTRSEGHDHLPLAALAATSPFSSYIETAYWSNYSNVRWADDTAPTVL
jgi:hypothetical protein